MAPSSIIWLPAASSIFCKRASMFCTLAGGTLANKGFSSSRSSHSTSAPLCCSASSIPDAPGARSAGDRAGARLEVLSRSSGPVPSLWQLRLYGQVARESLADSRFRRRDRCLAPVAPGSPGGSCRVWYTIGSEFDRQNNFRKVFIII